MNRVLLTVSGHMDPQIEALIDRGERPLADYIAMSRVFGADIIDYGRAAKALGLRGRLFKRLFGNNFLLAWACFKKRNAYDVIFTDGEQVGMPLALFFRLFGMFGTRPRHFMIVHILSVDKKVMLFDLLKLQKFIDVFFVYATWQKQFIETYWSISPTRVVWTPFMVDEQFFSSAQISEETNLPDIVGQGKPIICAVGLEFRDYPTLMKAVKGLDVLVVVAAGSPWSKRDDSTEGADIPDNVIVRRFTQYDLRELYARSQFVVMPLYNVAFQAGVTAILESMAMGKAVICSLTPGQTDVVVDGVSGIYVPPQEPWPLRMAIQRLLDNPEEAQAMGAAGRKIIEEKMSLSRYVQHLDNFVQQGKVTEEELRISQALLEQEAQL